MVRRIGGGRAASWLVLAVGMRCAREVATDDTCTVCRGVTQGFVDLHTEWSRVPNMEMAAQTFPHEQRAETDGDETLHRGDMEPITYEAAIHRFCRQSFLSSNQQRICYSIAPFAADVGKWLRMGMPPDRICRRLGTRNPETCFDARDAERPSDSAESLPDWRARPRSIPEGVDCSIEHRSSLSPRWVLLD